MSRELGQQSRLAQLSRSAFYYTPVWIDAGTLAMMKEIDRVVTEYPFFHCPAGDLQSKSAERGSRQFAAFLRREGTLVWRHRVRRLMARVGLEAI